MRAGCRGADDVPLACVRIRHGMNATSMLTLGSPALDWVTIAKGYSVESGRATTLVELAVQFKRGLDRHGPYLVELVM